MKHESAKVIRGAVIRISKICRGIWLLPLFSKTLALVRYTSIGVTALKNE